MKYKRLWNPLVDLIVILVLLLVLLPLAIITMIYKWLWDVNEWLKK